MSDLNAINFDSQPLVGELPKSVRELEVIRPLDSEIGESFNRPGNAADDNSLDIENKVVLVGHGHTATIRCGDPGEAGASSLPGSSSPTTAVPPGAARLPAHQHDRLAGLGKRSRSRELGQERKEVEDGLGGEDPANERKSSLALKYEDLKNEDEREEATLWSWVVLICTCALVMFIQGISSSFGVIYMEPLIMFGSQATMKSWIFSGGKSLFFIAGFMSGPMSTAYGHRILVVGVVVGALGLTLSSFAGNAYVFFITYSVMESMGYGFAHFVCYLNLQVEFPKRRGLATGAYLASKACARSLVPQLAHYLSAKYGYRWMMRLIAALSLNGVVLGLVVTSRGQAARSQPGKTDGTTEGPERGGVEMTSSAAQAEDRDRRGSGDSTCGCQETLQSCSRCWEPKKQKGQGCGTCCGGLKTRFQGVFDFGVFREPAFIALTMVDCFLGMTMESMPWALPFYAQERGFSPDVGALLLSVLGACDFVGRFLIPPLFDVKCLDYLCIFTVLLLVAAGASAGIGFQPSTEITVALCGLFGLAQSGTGGMPNVFLIRYLSAERFPSSMSAKTLFKFAFFCLGPIVGLMVDATQSYSTSLFIFSGLLVLTAAMSALLPCCVKKRSQ